MHSMVRLRYGVVLTYAVFALFQVEAAHRDCRWEVASSIVVTLPKVKYQGQDVQPKVECKDGILELIRTTTLNAEGNSKKSLGSEQRCCAHTEKLTTSLADLEQEAQKDNTHFVRIKRFFAYHETYITSDKLMWERKSMDPTSTTHAALKAFAIDYHTNLTKKIQNGYQPKESQYVLSDIMIDPVRNQTRFFVGSNDEFAIVALQPAGIFKQNRRKAFITGVKAFIGVAAVIGVMKGSCVLLSSK